MITYEIGAGMHAGFCLISGGSEPDDYLESQSAVEGGAVSLFSHQRSLSRENIQLHSPLVTFNGLPSILINVEKLCE
jgi:hypothetical protein